MKNKITNHFYLLFILLLVMWGSYAALSKFMINYLFPIFIAIFSVPMQINIFTYVLIGFIVSIALLPVTSSFALIRIDIDSYGRGFAKR